MFLHPDTGRLNGEFFIHFYLNQEGPWVFFHRPDLDDRKMAQYSPVFPGYGNHLADFDFFAPDLIGQRYRRFFTVLAKINHGNGQARTHRHAVQTAGAFNGFVAKGQAGNFITFRMDGLDRTNRGAGITWHFLITVEYWKYLFRILGLFQFGRSFWARL